MEFDWEDYHSLACELVLDDSPAKKRTSINRSYYSAYCIARDFLISNKAYLNNENKQTINSPESKAHSEVRKTFRDLHNVHGRGDKKIGRKIFKTLNRLRDKRNLADYQKEFSNLENEANKCIIDSRNVIDNLDNFL